MIKLTTLVLFTTRVISTFLLALLKYVFTSTLLTQFTVGTSCLFFLYLVHESESNLTHLLEELLHSLAHSATANSFQTIGTFQFLLR